VSQHAEVLYAVLLAFTTSKYDSNKKAEAYNDSIGLL
jgi:hypothetical protein